MTWLAFLIAAFLSGSIPFGLLLARLGGVDIRRHGSGNIGATNVWRVLGPRYGLPCFLLDVLKGLAPTLAAGLYHGLVPASLLATSIPPRESWLWLGVMAAPVLGHMFSPWVGFRGGKGVATGLGAMLGVFPHLALPAVGAAAAWSIAAWKWRYVSLASCLAAGVMPLLVCAVTAMSGISHKAMLPFYIATSALAALVVVRHRSNIRRLLAGTENRIGGRSPDAGAASTPRSDQSAV